MKRSIFIWFMMAAASVIPLASASDLNWSLTLNRPHLTHSWTPLPGGMRFQIGIFTGGFVPTADNISSWPVYWQARAETSYDSSLRGFGETMHVEETPSPFTAGQRLYIWGFFQNGPSTSEWILGTHTTWRMPTSDPFIAPVSIDLSQGDIIVGSTNTSASAIMTAEVASVAVPAISWDSWLSQHFFLVERGNESIGGKYADPDLDGVPNWMEYATGQNPRTAGSISEANSLAIARSGSNAVKLSFPGTQSAPGGWKIETSTDLKSWSETTPVLQFDMTEKKWWFTRTLDTPSRFWRLVAP